MFVRRLRPQAFAAAAGLRGMASGTGGKPKKSFFSSFSFRLGMVGAASAFAYLTIDKKVFHPAVENEVLEDLKLQKGGLVGCPTANQLLHLSHPESDRTICLAPGAQIESLHP
jgi:hypothetical protein